MKSKPARDRLWQGILALVLFLSGGISRSAGGEEGFDPKQAYATLRKRYFIAVALGPDRSGRPRKEHRQYVEAVDKFIESLDEADSLYRAGGHYLKGRILFRAKAYALAKEEFDACLKAFESDTARQGRRPPGLPNANSVRVVRAFAVGEEEQVDVILTELEAISAEQAVPQYHDVGAMVNKWADSLLYKEELDQATRAYEFIRKFELWEGDRENPARKIELVQYRRQSLQGGQPGAAQPQPAAAGAAPQGEQKQDAAKKQHDDWN